MRRNIELKARFEDLDAARRIAETAGAKLHTFERQRDTYFRCENGRLKLRQRWTKDGECSELIGYERSDADRPRASDYSIVPVADGEGLRNLLAAALGVAVQVDKCRTVYLYENVRIHLDEVDRLGTFIEFEAVLDGYCSEEQAHGKLEDLVEAFGIGSGQIVPVSYSDLPVGAGQPERGQPRARRGPVGAARAMDGESAAPSPLGAGYCHLTAEKE